MLSCQCDKVILRLLYYKAKETFLHILILGSGGREHSITWAVKQNPKCTKLSCAPGNAGIAKIAACIESINMLSIHVHKVWYNVDKAIWMIEDGMAELDPFNASARFGMDNNKFFKATIVEIIVTDAAETKTFGT